MTEEIRQNETGILFDGSKFEITHDILPIFYFLKGIEIEIENILGFDNKLEKLRSGYLEIFNFTKFLAEKLKENNINFEYNLNHNLFSLMDEFHFNSPDRSQMISLFASLEVLYFLYISYEQETSNDDILRKIAMSEKKFYSRFIRTFLFTDQNQYYLENKERLNKIDPIKIRKLRNSLTHFFSLAPGGLSIAPSNEYEKARRLEKKLQQDKKGYIVFISTKDLFELIKFANILMFKKWSDDFLLSPNDFRRKIQYVITVVRDNGAVIIMNKDLKI